MSVGQKLPCFVEKIIHHGEHVFTVDLRPNRPVTKFRPGHFLHLALDDYDPSGFWPDSRAFSIASSPFNRNLIRISYSVRGRFTGRMEAELVEGRQVWIKLPYGEFAVDNTGDVVLFAGGTGITAFTAFLDGLTSEYHFAVYLVYGARIKSLLIYRDLVQQKIKTVPSLHVSYFVEQDTETRQAIKEPNKFYNTGCVSVASIWPNIQSPKEANYYISGPPVMLQTISQDLRNMGIEENAIKIDTWE